MNARGLIAMVVLAAVVAAAAGCGGGGADPAGGGGSSGTVKGGILRVGTTDYIDSLNPFVAIDVQSANAVVMLYPQLVQYGPGEKLQGDWATSWTQSSDGLTWTFHLRPGGKWSDGKPLTAADAAWTGNLIVKYSNGPTAAVAAALSHVTSMDAPNATTLVIHYNNPVANVLPQLEQFFILPEHIWKSQVGTAGKGLKSFRPEQHLPTVAGGPYSITQFQEKGTTVFKPNPYFYGPKSNAEAVEQLRAESWANRTRRELRASGEHRRRQSPEARDDLTTQERQIAALAAEGQTNREIAALLFLSPRTIESHLGHVFRKLGISDRTALPPPSDHP